MVYFIIVKTTCGRTDLICWTNIIFIIINKVKRWENLISASVKRVFPGLQEEMTHVDERGQVAKRTDSQIVASGNNPNN